MPFAGETIRLISRIKDYDDELITDTSGVTVTIDLFNPDKTHLAGPFPMAYNATGDDDGPYWYYDWDSTGVVKGNYRSKVMATGGGLNAWQNGRVRLTESAV